MIIINNKSHRKRAEQASTSHSLRDISFLLTHIITSGYHVLSMAERDIRSGVSAEVVTIEGPGTIGNRHLIQEAYVLSGTIQCRFCAPPMIVAAIFPQQTVESE
jgi:hypothetical protein